MAQNKLVTLDKGKITVDIPLAELFVQEGKGFLLNPKAEEPIIKLRTAIEMLEQFEEEIKQTIMEKGRELNPDFKGVKGKEINLIVRKYGSKYTHDKNREETLLPFLSETKYYKVDSTKVDEYIEKVGEMPDGIHEKDREDKLSITRVKGVEEEDE